MEAFPNTEIVACIWKSLCKQYCYLGWIPLIYSWYKNGIISSFCDLFLFAYISLVAITKNISDSNGIRTHNHLVHKRTLNYLAKWLSVHLRTKWLWVQILLLSLKLHISYLFWARSSLTFRQLQSADSLWNAYMTR